MHLEFAPALAGNPIAALLPEDVPVVFVVDDDISVRQSLAILIQCVGWRAETFESASEFLQRPRTSSPNCLLLDVNLPDRGALDLQRTIRAESQDTPIIFISGYGDVQRTAAALKSGAIDFLTKPFDVDALLSAIAQALERSSIILPVELEL